jgi:hypothetical protein
VKRHLTKSGKVLLGCVGILVVTIVVGVLIGGSTGTTITAIAAIILAVGIVAAVGLGKDARDGLGRTGWPND